MGACVSDEESKASREITQQNKADHKARKKTKKILLLGAGSSGKSTIFKQLHVIHGIGVDAFDPIYRAIIRQNCVQSICALIQKSYDLHLLSTNQVKTH